VVGGSCGEDFRYTQENSVAAKNSAADPDPGSGAFLTPGSRIPNPYFSSLNDKFLGKKY